MRKIERQSIEKYLLAKSSWEESKRIKKWLQEDVDWDVNSSIVKDIHRKTQMWEKIVRNMQKKESPLKAIVTSFKVVKSFYRVVAAVILFVLIGKSYYFFSERDRVQESDLICISRKMVDRLSPASSLPLIGFPNVEKTIYYEIDSESNMQLFNSNGNIFIRNDQRNDARIKLATNGRDYMEFVAKKGQTYVIVYTGEDDFLRRANDLFILPVDQLGNFPPHDAIQWTKNQLAGKDKIQKV